MSERAQALEAALREIVEDLEARWDMSDPRTNPGIRDNVTRARGLLSAKDHLCDGCLCSVDACAAYRKAGKICCPDCDHMRRPQPDEKGHLPTCSSWRCAWEWSTADGAGVCRLSRGSEIHYIGTVDSHAFMALPCDCVPASLSPVEPTPPQEFIDIEPEIRVVRIYRNGSWLEDIKAGGRRHASFPAVEPTPEPPTHERCHDLVCNASRDHHRGAKGVGCSCAGRDAAYQELAALKPTGAPAPCVWQLNAGNRYSTTCGRSYSNLPWEVAEWSVCPHCTAPLTVER